MIIEPKNDFSGIFVSSLDKKQGIDQCREALLTIAGRVRNTGMVYLTPEGKDAVLEIKGRAPVLVEAQDALIRFKNRMIEEVIILNLDGKVSSGKVVVKNNAIVVDGIKDKSIWYLIRFVE